MSIFKNRKYLWIGPTLVFIAGIINLSNSNLSDSLKLAWYILLPISAVLSIYGIICHIKKG